MTRRDPHMPPVLGSFCTPSTRQLVLLNYNRTAEGLPEVTIDDWNYIYHAAARLNTAARHSKELGEAEQAAKKKVQRARELLRLGRMATRKKDKDHFSRLADCALTDMLQWSPK